MIRYRIEMPRVLRDLIRHLPPELKAKVKAALRSISDDPYRAKELRGRIGRLEKLPGSQVPSYLSHRRLRGANRCAWTPYGHLRACGHRTQQDAEKRQNRLTNIKTDPTEFRALMSLGDG